MTRMSFRFCSLTAAFASLALLFVAPTASQAQKPVTKAAKPWTVPRTVDGQPDFQGYWTNATVTPLERPVELGTKEFFTEEEAAAYAKQRNDKENSQSSTDIHYDNVLWQSEH